MKARHHSYLVVAVTAFVMSLASGASYAAQAQISRMGNADTQSLLTLRGAKSIRTKSWFHPQTSSSSPLIYASLITSISTGETNIYQQSGSSLELVGQLSEGGGPIATDSKGNVYVAEAGSNILGFVPRNIYVYRPGATAPSLVLDNPNYMTWSIAVSPSGTVYAAGLSVASSSRAIASVTEYQLPSTIPSPAPSATPQSITGTLLPAVSINPAVPTGLAVDASGNLFAGWIPNTGSPCVRGPLQGCGTELPVNGPPWRNYLPLGQAENDINAGPVLTANDAQTIVAGSGGFEFLITFPKGSFVPSRVTPLTVSGAKAVPGIMSLAVDSGGEALWAANGFLASSGSAALGYRIWKLQYPSGTVAVDYSIPQGGSASPSGLAVPLNSALAVGPAYVP
jgi:hypothetical protein